jgi:dTDP-4-amino-4,6-dideoxygalactose transaminase
MTPPVAEGDVHSFWKYCLRVDPDVVEGGSPALGKELAALGIASAPRYIQKPAFVCEIFQKRRTFGDSQFPFTLARPEAVDYERARFPGVYSGLERILVLPWNENYTDEHVRHIANAVSEAAHRLAG